MRVKITYLAPNNKEHFVVEGELIFGDALLNEFIGVRDDEDNFVQLVPQGSVLRIDTYEFDEDLFKVDVESVRRSKHAAMQRMSDDLDRGQNRSGFHG